MNDAPDSKTLSKQRYSRFAAGYVKSETHAKGSDLDRLLAIARPEAQWQALDIATGGGHTALKFAPHVAHVIASDLTEAMLRQAEEFIRGQLPPGKVSFRQADAENLPFDERQFDLVTCRIAPHHFPDVRAFASECARVLKRKGLLILQDQILPDHEEAAACVDGFERLRDPSHHRAYTLDEWRAMLEAAGFAIEHSETYIKRHEFVKWARRQGNDAATIARLTQMLRDAPTIAREWMAPLEWGKPNASFVNRHGLLRARLD